MIVEVKAGLTLQSTAPRQLYNYLRATDKEVGLLLHFGPEARYYREYCPNLKKDRQSDASGIVRVIRQATDGAVRPEVPVEDSPQETGL